MRSGIAACVTGHEAGVRVIWHGTIHSRWHQAVGRSGASREAASLCHTAIKVVANGLVRRVAQPISQIRIGGKVVATNHFRSVLECETIMAKSLAPLLLKTLRIAQCLLVVEKIRVLSKICRNIKVCPQ